MFDIEYLECSPEFQELVDSFLDEWHRDLPYITAHTSGSTGTPKEIRLLKTDMLASARSTNHRFDITSDSILFSPLSASYIAGKMMIVRALAANCRMVFTTPSNHFFDRPPIREFILASKPALIPVVPSQLSAPVDNIEDYAQLLRAPANIIIGGASISPSMEEKLLSVGGAFYVTYGMTETCSHVALRRLGQPAYHAMPGISFAQDNRGCLIVKAPEFSFNSLQTNDIADLSDDSLNFVWRGRFDNVINSGGIKIFPEHLEQLLQQSFTHPFFFKGLPDKKWGEAVAMVTTAPPSISDTEIMAICRKKLPRHSLPTSIIRVDRLPLTSNGKLRRNSL